VPEAACGVHATSVSFSGSRRQCGLTRRLRVSLWRLVAGAGASRRLHVVFGVVRGMGKVLEVVYGVHTISGVFGCVNKVERES